MRKSVLSLVILVVAAVAATAAPPAAFDAQPRYTSMTVNMRAPVSNATAATLVIAGPGGFRMERTFATGEPIQVDLSRITDAEGATVRLADGIYKWELRVVRKSAAAVPSTGTQPADPAESPSEDYLATGVFRVSFGSIAGPIETERPQTEAAQPATATGQVGQAVVSPADLEVRALTTNPNGNHFVGDLTATGNFCAGSSLCTDGYNAGWDAHLRDTALTDLGLEDDGVDDAGETFFTLQVYDATQSFTIRDTENSLAPLTIEEGTPNNTLYLDSAGLVGVGTSTPNIVTTLSLFPAGAWVAGWTLDNGGGTNYIGYVNGSGYFGIGKDTDCALCITPTAQVSQTLNIDGDKVGIRILNPTSPLHVKVAATTDPILMLDGTNATDSLSLKVRHPNGVVGFGIAGGAGAFFSTANQHDAVVYGQPGYNLLLGVGGSEWLRITNAGRVGIGQAAPAHPLHMASGAHVTTGGVWTNASSRSYKQDIAELPADSAVEVLAKLSPVTFAYKADPSEKHAGFIAEDVPDMLATADRQGLSPMDIVAVLTKVLQEQQRTIAELQARVAHLETK